MLEIKRIKGGKGSRKFFIEIEGGEFFVCQNGFLQEGHTGLKQFGEKWQRAIMKQEGINELTDEHQKVLDAAIGYFLENGNDGNIIRVLSKKSGVLLKRIFEIFPSGPSKGACKMAGLPNP